MMISSVALKVWSPDHQQQHLLQQPHNLLQLQYLRAPLRSIKCETLMGGAAICGLKRLQVNVMYAEA